MNLTDQLAVIDAVLALYGIPEPPPTSANDVAEVLHTLARNQRASKTNPVDTGNSTKVPWRTSTLEKI